MRASGTQPGKFAGLLLDGGELPPGPRVVRANEAEQAQA
jgi:hypothetical protein